MLKDDRLSKIVELVNKNKTLRTDEIADKLNISLATVRRDLNELDENKRIKKIFGGAKAVSQVNFVTTEEAMTEKQNINMREKLAIGERAASLIEENDLVYMDAGSSVEAMVSYIKNKEVTFVTNSIGIARELSSLKYKVYILPGQIKLSTDSIVGIAASEYLRRYNFTIGFFGTNGLHKDFGFTTPDINEALVKSAAIERCKRAYILADSSKFEKISQVTFSNELDLPIITEDIDKDKRIVSKIINLKEAL